MKYKRFVDEIGGWSALQTILDALALIARKHEVTIANVASRWVLEHEAVAAIIIGAHLGESEHRADNVRVFEFALDAEDRERIDDALARASRLPGDCGDEYRRAPFLTASGDLTGLLAHFPKAFPAHTTLPSRRQLVATDRLRLVGCSSAVRSGNWICVGGTRATHGNEVICPHDAYGQAVYIMDNIAARIEALGGTMADVVRIRIYVSDRRNEAEICRIHRRVFGRAQPIITVTEVPLENECKVEIEAEAIIDESHGT